MWCMCTLACVCEFAGVYTCACVFVCMFHVWVSEFDEHFNHACLKKSSNNWLCFFLFCNSSQERIEQDRRERLLNIQLAMEEESTPSTNLPRYLFLRHLVNKIWRQMFLKWKKKRCQGRESVSLYTCLSVCISIHSSPSLCIFYLIYIYTCIQPSPENSEEKRSSLEPRPRPSTESLLLFLRGKEVIKTKKTIFYHPSIYLFVNISLCISIWSVFLSTCLFFISLCLYSLFLSIYSSKSFQPSFPQLFVRPYVSVWTFMRSFSFDHVVSISPYLSLLLLHSCSLSLAVFFSLCMCLSDYLVNSML